MDLKRDERGIPIEPRAVLLEFTRRALECFKWIRQTVQVEFYFTEDLSADWHQFCEDCKGFRSFMEWFAKQTLSACQKESNLRKGEVSPLAIHERHAQLIADQLRLVIESAASAVAAVKNKEISPRQAHVKHLREIGALIARLEKSCEAIASHPDVLRRAGELADWSLVELNEQSDWEGTLVDGELVCTAENQVREYFQTRNGELDRNAAELTMPVGVPLVDIVDWLTKEFPATCLTARRSWRAFLLTRILVPSRQDEFATVAAKTHRKTIEALEALKTRSEFLNRCSTDNSASCSTDQASRDDFERCRELVELCLSSMRDRLDYLCGFVSSEAILNPATSCVSEVVAS